MIAATLLIFLSFSISSAEAATAKIRVLIAGGSDGSMTQVESGDVVVSGAKFRVEITPAATGPISVSFKSAHGEKTVLHKAADAQAGKRIVLPKADDWYQLDQNAGTERIIVEQKGQTTEHVMMHTARDAFQVAKAADLGPLKEPEPLTRGIGNQSSPSDSFGADSSAPPPDFDKALEKLQPEKKGLTRSFGSENLYSKIAPGVVFVVAGKSIGSGSIISNRGHIVTNWHVVRPKKRVGIIFKAEGVNVKMAAVYPAAVLRYDEVADLALVKVFHPPPNITVLRFGKLDDVKIGMRVHAIGHPSGESWTYTQGVVSQVHKAYRWITKSRIKHAATVIQTQTPISPGSSGGPLLSDNGMIVGVNTFYSKRNRMGYSVSPVDVERFLAAKTSRRSERVPPKHAGRKCKPRLLGVTDKTPLGYRQGYRAYHYDTNCNGRADAIRVARSRGARATFLQLDKNEDGVADVRVYYRYKNRYNLWIYYKHGRAYMVGYDYDFDGKIDRYQKKQIS